MWTDLRKEQCAVRDGYFPHNGAGNLRRAGKKLAQSLVNGKMLLIEAANTAFARQGALRRNRVPCHRLRQAL